MDLFCPSFPEKIYDAAAGGSPDDGVVDKHDPLVLYTVLHSAQLDLYLIQP